MDMSTTADYAKFDDRYLREAVTQEDVDRVQQMLTGLSAAFEKVMDRHVEQVERTEVFTILNPTRLVFLKGYPLADIASVQVDGVELDATDWSASVETGRLGFNTAVQSDSFDALSVTYTGGMATDTAAFVALYPDIQHEMHKQLKFELNRPSNITQEMANFQLRISMFLEVKYLTSVEQMLGRYKRKLPGVS